MLVFMELHLFEVNASTPHMLTQTSATVDIAVAALVKFLSRPPFFGEICDSG